FDCVYWLIHACFLCLFSPLFFFLPVLLTPSTEIYTLSLHDALPILYFHSIHLFQVFQQVVQVHLPIKNNNGYQIESQSPQQYLLDRKSTRLNSSHVSISYAVFCLKKKNNKHKHQDEHEYGPSS